MANKEYKKGCNHDDMANYHEIINNKYFVKEYYNCVTYPVFECSECLILFGTNYKVTAKNALHCCENGKLSHHKCVIALCSPCYNNKFIFNNDTTSTKKRKRTTVIV